MYHFSGKSWKGSSAMMSKSRPTVMVEAIEQRVLFDASALTETILSNTLPAAVSDQGVLHGTLSMSVANNSGFAEKDPGSIVSFVISSTPLNPPALNFYILKELKTTISLADGASKAYKFQINIPKGKLVDGAFTIYALIVDSGSDFSQSQPGPTLNIHPPIVTLSETENFLKLTDAASTGTKVHITDQVAITNSGTDPSATALTIGIYATQDGVPADGSLMTGVTKKVVINPGKTVTVPVTVAAIPSLSAGTYKLITQVTQTNGTITQTDPSTAPTFTLTQSVTGPQFTDSFIGSPTPTYTSEPLDGAVEYLSAIEFEMSISNTGGSPSDGTDTFTLFASPDSTFDSNAVQIGQVPLSLDIPQRNGVRNFFIKFNTDASALPTNDAADYLYIQVQDPTGTITMASDSTPIELFQTPGQ
jgi:hypothetical protein